MSDSLSTRELVHEMRNELAVARANLEGLVDAKLAPTKERLLGIIQALHQLETLINDIPLGAPDGTMPLRPTYINVCELLGREYRAMEAVAQARGVMVRIDRCATPAAGCLHFYGDAPRIGQIVKNVLLNAIRYSPEGGSVSVNCSRRADELEVRISDDGPGIATSEKGRVYEPGFRGAASAGTSGSGYGLAVVKQLVEAHGGTITASKVVPHGAAFTIRLPAAAMDESGPTSSQG